MGAREGLKATSWDCFLGLMIGLELQGFIKAMGSLGFALFFLPNKITVCSLQREGKILHFFSSSSTSFGA